MEWYSSYARILWYWCTVHWSNFDKKLDNKNLHHHRLPIGVNSKDFQTLSVIDSEKLSKLFEIGFDQIHFFIILSVISSYECTNAKRIKEFNTSLNKNLPCFDFWYLISYSNLTKALKHTLVFKFYYTKKVEFFNIVIVYIHSYCRKKSNQPKKKSPQALCGPIATLRRIFIHSASPRV